MEALLHIGVINVVWTAVLALAAAIGTRIWRRHPAVGHTLWLIVLLKLVTPSLVQVAVPSASAARREVTPLVAPAESRSSLPEPLPSLEPKPGRSESAFPRIVHPAEDLDQEPVKARWKPSRPPAAQSLSRWAITRNLAVFGVVFLWLGGALVWWSVMGLNSVRFRRLVRSAQLAPAELRQTMGRIAERLGLRNVPEVCVLPCRVSPMVWVPLAGRSRLVLPEELWSRFNRAQQEAVLTHELAHLKRRDHWVRRLEALACGLYWWDPIAWWARREVERAEERCCDAWVLWALPTAAAAYAEALVVTAVYLSGLRQPLPLGASGVGRLSPLKGRLQMILSDPTTVSFQRTVPRALLIWGALSLPFLPALASGEAPIAAPRVAAISNPSGDQPAKAATKATQTEKRPNLATAPEKRKGDLPAHAPRPGPVRVTQPLVRDVSVYQPFVAGIRAAGEAGLKARVSGTIIQVTCRPGQTVKRDERLFQIDSRPYRAALERAEAEHEGALARQKLAQMELSNAKFLFEQKQVISQRELDLHEPKFLEATASVKAGMAARDAARLNLEFTEIKAPFDGTISGPVLGPGNVAVADSTLLATIVSTDRVYVYFNVPEAQYLEYMASSQQQKDEQKIELKLANGNKFPQAAQSLTVEGHFNNAAGNIAFRADFPNPSGLLRHGQTGTVLLSHVLKNAVVIPMRAVFEVMDKRYVYVVDKDDVARQNEIMIQDELEDVFVIKKGVGAGDRIVFDGVRQVRDGEKVKCEFRPPEAVMGKLKTHAE